jgi:hypothetical protein
MSGPVPIVERLRAATPAWNHSANAGLCHEAADTITDLLGALEDATVRLANFARAFGNEPQTIDTMLAKHRAAITRATSPHDTSSQGEGK